MTRTMSWIPLALATLLLSGFSGGSCYPSGVAADEGPFDPGTFCNGLDEERCLEVEGCDASYAAAEFEGCAANPDCPGVLCELYCKDGFAPDANGCLTCECLPPVCAPVLCELYCERGFAVDENGCEVCACAEPLSCTSDEDCPSGEACLLTDCGPDTDCRGAGICEPVYCLDVITYATDPSSGSCLPFPTPCDVPAGWAPCDPACGDGSVLICDSLPPECGEGGLAVVRDGCWACVDAATCEPMCIQVIAYAADPATGVCTEFPTPCDVPAGWEPCVP